MLRLVSISGILLLSSLLALFIPLAISFHHHPNGNGGDTLLEISQAADITNLTVDNRCDLCARLLIYGVREVRAISMILPDYTDISFLQSEIPVSSNPLSRLKDRSPPASPVSVNV